MPRIRSVHPGLFTDEAFMSVSIAARLLVIGCWVEADDSGVFEWKPVRLKARIFPVDNIDVAAVLEELAAANMIRAFEEGGRQYGAIRNFRKWQRPKYPKASHPLPTELIAYVGLALPIPEIEGDERGQFPQNGEKSPQREDVGGRRKEEGSKQDTGPSARASKKYAFQGSIIRLTEADFLKWKAAYHAIPDLMAELQGLDDYWVTDDPGEKWFHATSAALKKKHNAYAKAPANGKDPFVAAAIKDDPGRLDRARERQRLGVKNEAAEDKWFSKATS